MSLDPDTAGEIINDVFLVVWDKAAQFRGDSHVSTWIMGIAYRKALTALKRRKPMVTLEAVEQELLASNGFDGRCNGPGKVDCTVGSGTSSGDGTDVLFRLHLQGDWRHTSVSGEHGENSYVLREKEIETAPGGLSNE